METKLTHIFEGQAAIVTGGAQGLGEGIVHMLVENGCSVMVFDVNGPKAKACAESLRSKGGRVEWYEMDVSQEESVRKGFTVFREKFAQLDIMVNCAGIMGPSGVKADQVSVEEFDRVYEVNVRGSFLMTKYSLEEMKKRNYGRILLIASLAGKEGCAMTSAYSCSKAAVIGLVKSVGKEFAETGITVNALAPTVVWTAMAEAVPLELVKFFIDKIPMKRCGEIAEVCSITKFIVSKEASFNTAFCFDLSGGRATY